MSESKSAVVVDARPAHRLFLFDVDGTLTTPRQRITAELEQFFKEVRQQARIGIVGGSDLVKQIEQLGEQVLHEWDYVFSENGLVAFQMGKELARQSIKDYLGETKLKQFINFVLHYIADLDIPVKRGTFIEFRAGMLNISPIGRNCSQAERVEFEKYDHIHKIRSTFVSVLQEKFGDLALKYTIGGQISFDVFPQGWDKTYCLRYLDSFTEIHFFGDKTDQGGNDYEIYTHPRCIGHSVKSPDDTRRIVAELLKQAQAQAQA